MNEVPNTPNQRFSERNAVLLKAGLIAVITLLLLIPTAMINGLVHDRESTKNQSINEVGRKWGLGQTLTGPFVTVPYTITEKRYSPRDSTNVWIERTEYLKCSLKSRISEV